MTYNGEEQKYEPVVTDGEKTLVKDRDYTLAYSTNDLTGVGTKTVTVTGIGNYAGSKAVSYAIEKLELEIAITGHNATATYDGDPHTTVGFEAANANTLFSATKVNYDGETEISRTDAGTTNMDLDLAKFSYDDGNIAASFTLAADGYVQIDPSTMTVAREGYSGTYDGTAHSVTVTPSITAGTTVEYQKIVAEGEEAWSTTVPSIKDVGSASYNVKVTNLNYEDVTFTLDLSVKAKDVTIAAQAEGKTYGENDPEQFKNATIGTYFNGELDDIDLTVTRPGAGVPANEQAGIHKGALTTGLDAEELNAQYKNYNFTVEDADFTIAKKEITITADSISKFWGYNDPDEFFATIPEGSLVGDDKISYKVTRVAGERATDTAIDDVSSDVEGEVIGVGEYPISVTLTEEPDNYDVKTEPGKLTIIKTPVVIKSSIDGLKEVYSGTIVELTAQMNGLDTKYSGNYNYQWQISDSEDGPFVDIEKNANERVYKYILNKHTAGKHYRVIVTINYDNINK